jgi:hypothetical protein
VEDGAGSDDHEKEEEEDGAGGDDDADDFSVELSGDRCGFWFHHDDRLTVFVDKRTQISE